LSQRRTRFHDRDEWAKEETGKNFWYSARRIMLESAMTLPWLAKSSFEPLLLIDYFHLFVLLLCGPESALGMRPMIAAPDPILLRIEATTAL
jgi:hypothetical protein